MAIFCRVNSCCCGCSLRTGTLILIIIELIYAIGIVITASSLASYIQKELLNDSGYDEIYAIYVALAVFSALMIVMDVLVIIGSNKNKPALLLPWLVYAVINILSYLVLLILLSVNFFQSDNTVNGISSIISMLIGLGIKWYFASVIYSHYKDMQSGNTMGGMPRTA